MRLSIKYKIFFLSLWFLLSGGAALIFARPDDGNLTEAIKTYSRLSNEQKNLVNSSMGMPDLSGFSFARIMAWLIFGAVGFVAFSFGRKQSNFKALAVGIVLMGYPYFVTDTFWLYAVGIGLCFLLYFWRD